jgi:hypothetical protein
MRRDVHRRIEKLEQQAGLGAKPLPIVFFYFSDGANHAKTDGLEWHRRPNEEKAAFESRILGDPAFADHRQGFVVWLFD